MRWRLLNAMAVFFAAASGIAAAESEPLPIVGVPAGNSITVRIGDETPVDVRVRLRFIAIGDDEQHEPARYCIRQLVVGKRARVAYLARGRSRTRG